MSVQVLARAEWIKTWADTHKLLALVAVCGLGLCAEVSRRVIVGIGDPTWSSITITNNDIDVMVRTVIGEAADEPDEGKAAVAWVILNRARMNMPHYGGNNVADVALHKASVMRPSGKRIVWQFEPWMHTKIRGYLWAIPKSSNKYQHVLSIVRGCVSGEIPDPTGGATHFLNPDIVKSRTGGSLPSWASGEQKRIGTHVFYKHAREAL